MEKTFEIKYGDVTVRNVVLEENDNTTLCDGIEIRSDDMQLIEIYQYYDVAELTQEKVEELIKLNI